jgi:type VI secretion system Hcp family effector
MSAIHRVRSALLAAGIGFAAIAPAIANPIYAKFTGVSGAVVARGFEGAVELTAYSQEFTDPATINSLNGSGRGAGRARTTCGAITISKAVDKASPTFVQFTTRGQVINTATIYFVGNNNGDTLNVPYTITLSRVRLTSIMQGDTVGNTAGLGITENISMIAETIQFTFNVQDPATGAVTQEKYGWNCSTDSPF